MASYRIEWKTSAVKELKNLDRSVVGRMVRVVGFLADKSPRKWLA